MLKVLDGFRHQVSRRITGKTGHSTTGREWECPPAAEALDTTGIYPIKEYIQRRQATIAAHVAFSTIYELCMGESSMMVCSRFMRWWDQDVGR